MDCGKGYLTTLLILLISINQLALLEKFFEIQLRFQALLSTQLKNTSDY